MLYPPFIPSGAGVGPPGPGYAVAPEGKYSLFTQFLKHSGIRPIIARLISLAAISRNSVQDGSE